MVHCDRKYNISYYGIVLNGYVCGGGDYVENSYEPCIWHLALSDVRVSSPYEPPLTEASELPLPRAWTATWVILSCPSYTPEALLGRQSMR
jgi:hypothetical protein